MTRIRFALLCLAALAALALAGCGGGSSATDLAGFAAPDSLVYVEGQLTPSGALKANVDSLARKIAGVDNLGNYIAAKLEASAKKDGEPVDFAKEVKPWLGERAAIAFQTLKGGNLKDPVMVLQTNDAAAAREFIERRAHQSSEPYEKASYEGIEFEVGGSEGNAIGVVGNDLVLADDKAGFEAAVDASNGESLAGSEEFEQAISHAVDGSLADVYVNVGGLLEQSNGEIGPQALQALKTAGIDPREATAMASLVPGSEQVEIDVSANAGGEAPPTGDASKLLGSLPANSFVALASTGFGERLKKSLDELDASGIPGKVGPHELKKAVSQLGFDLDEVAASLEDSAIFAAGTDKANLGGALVLTTSSDAAVETVSRLGILLRGSGTAGVTAVKNGEASGFSIRSEQLGPRPLVVVSEGQRVAIGYGVGPALQGLGVADEATLAANPTYKAAVSSLGATPISGFVSGPATLHLAEALVPPSDTGFTEATRYLKAIRYIAIGAGSEGDLATAKLIVGIGE